LEQQLELEYGVSVRGDRDSYRDEDREAEAGLHRQQGEVAQCKGVITKLTDQVEELRGQRSSLRRDLQELRAILEDCNSRLEDMRVMLENCNDEVAALEVRATHTREERDRLQLRHNEADLSLVTTQQELAEARSATTRTMEAEALKER